MKTQLKVGMAIIIAISFLSLGHADTAIRTQDLPGPVTAALQEYFPGSKALSVEKDTDNGKTRYEVKIQYKQIVLEVDLTPEGGIVDVDKEN